MHSRSGAKPIALTGTKFVTVRNNATSEMYATALTLLEVVWATRWRGRHAQRARLPEAWRASNARLRRARFVARIARRFRRTMRAATAGPAPGIARPGDATGVGPAARRSRCRTAGMPGDSWEYRDALPARRST